MSLDLKTRLEHVLTPGRIMSLEARAATLRLVPGALDDPDAKELLRDLRKVIPDSLAKSDEDLLKMAVVLDEQGVVSEALRVGAPPVEVLAQHLLQAFGRDWCSDLREALR
jgi:hypothetical protein